jgi:hypothetical protein
MICTCVPCGGLWRLWLNGLGHGLIEVANSNQQVVAGMAQQVAQLAQSIAAQSEQTAQAMAAMT